MDALMRRQGQYVDTTGNMNERGQMHMGGQIMEQDFEAFTPEREDPYRNSEVDRQWRWERGGSLVKNSNASHMLPIGRGDEPPNLHPQGQKPDPRIGLDNLANHDVNSQQFGKNNDLAYRDDPLSTTMEGLQQKFLDETMKLTKEQSEVEDAEISRHRERINEINVQYQEQLAAVRSQHATRRNEFLGRESLDRQQQYQRVSINRNANETRRSDHNNYSEVAGAAAPVETHRAYDNVFNRDRERAELLRTSRDQSFQSRAPYHGIHGYGPGSRPY